MSICRNCTTNCQSSSNRGYGSDHDGTLAVGLTEIALARVVRHVIEYFAKGLALEIGTIGVADEEEVHLTLLQHDLLDTQLLALDTEGHHTDKFLGDCGNLTEAVSEACAIGFQRGIQVVTVRQIVEFAIEQHALRVAGDVLIGEIHLDIGFEGAVIDEVC